MKMQTETLTKHQIIDSRIDIGSRWAEEISGEYILATSDGLNCVLISLFSGNRFTEGIEVTDRLNVSGEEFNKICGSGIFTKIKNSPYKY